MEVSYCRPTPKQCGKGGQVNAEVWNVSWQLFLLHWCQCSLKVISIIFFNLLFKSKPQYLANKW